jgi:hypothetical protein
MKSTCAATALPAWILGRDPSAKIICASYATELATLLSRNCRAVVTSDWYQALFPATRVSAEKNTETMFTTTKRGYRFATSVGGSLTGLGADYLIIDDPLKPQDALSEAVRDSCAQWFFNTAFSRLDHKTEGVIIIVTHQPASPGPCHRLRDAGEAIWRSKACRRPPTPDVRQRHGQWRSRRPQNGAHAPIGRTAGPRMEWSQPCGRGRRRLGTSGMATGTDRCRPSRAPSPGRVGRGPGSLA